MLSFILAVSLGLGPDAFETGPLIEEFGPNAVVETTMTWPADTQFRVSFDTTDAGDADAPLPAFVTAARFLNMHARAGVPADQLHLAVVVHGGVVRDLAALKNTPDHPGAILLERLLAQNTRVIVCGQSAAYHGVSAQDLPQGVDMALSAMTAHAVLQQDGYTLNPF